MQKKILLIDDEIEILNVLKLFLTKKGFDVTEVERGQDGLDILEKDTSFDLIILDHRMPGMKGAEVVEQLKARDIDIPVIILTGSLGKDVRLLPASGFLMKPVDLMDLLNKINELI